MKPKGLKETTIIMCIFNICGFAFLDPLSRDFYIHIIFGILIIGFSYFVLWQYWKGKNWARILVIITSIIALINLIGFMEQNLIQKIIVLSEAIFACYLLYWLNRKEIKSYFRNRTIEP